VTKEDPAALVAALETLAGSSTEQQRLADAAAQAARTDFNPDTIQAQFVDALHSAVEAHRADKACKLGQAA
jgi:hypothetical protein